MLYLQIDPPAGLFAPRRLRDDERQLTFTHVGVLDRGSLDAFELVWAERHIPITTRYQRRNRADGSSFLLYSEPQIDGLAATAQDYSGVRTSLSSDESAIATQLATECLLAFGQAYDGLKAPADAYAVQTSDGQVSLDHFGY